MKGYYEQKLSALNLKECYDIAGPRVRQYFAEELSHVLGKIRVGDWVLDLGCGYGRVIPALAKMAGKVIGIDSSLPSLKLAREFYPGLSNCFLAANNALQLGFAADTFDVVVCIQNGISAFHVDRKALICETMRVTKPGGIILFSSYSERFWDHRLEWFRMQAAAGLLGEIDEERTGNGVIICKDGFRANTVSFDEFLSLTADIDAEVNIIEVDESSLFCEIIC
jgi:ubiquinone/menaquinone biosynthesis C-methylase UbiE